MVLLNLSVITSFQRWGPRFTAVRWRSKGKIVELEAAHDSYLPNHRFWTKNIEHAVDNSTISSTINSIKVAIEANRSILPSAQMGVVIHKNLLVPIHDGMVQPQHAIMTEDNLNINEEDVQQLLILGFSPRANDVSVSPDEEERPIDEIRLAALDVALAASNDDITGLDLLSDKFAGTSPARIYRSFISPRAKAKYTIEPVERAATRTASQILLSLRQVRADQASYLRNTDKSVHLQDDHSGKPLNPMALVLDNVRSAFNVGSMFRTSETAGACELVTCGITPHPPHPKLRKTAFTSVDVVPSRHFEDTLLAVQQLKAEGYSIVVMETTERSQQYTEVAFPAKVAIVMGNEVTGVDPRVMEMADIIVEIPTFGVKNSLNVASAAPIVMFEVLRQWNEKKKKTEEGSNAPVPIDSKLPITQEKLETKKENLEIKRIYF